MASVFFSYSHADEALRDQLEKQLSMLKRQGVIETWHDRRIPAGSELDHSISEHVENDNILLLLVSADFLASDYCYDREMQRAMERHNAGNAVVIPVILRACDWQQAPFGKLMATPTDGRPITQWPDRDQAFLEVAKQIRSEAVRLNEKAGAPKSSLAENVQAAMSAVEPFPAPSQAPAMSTPPRSSNLRLAKQFTQKDKDVFKHESFEYLAKFFENSLTELAERNPGIDGVFRRIDANRFTASIYQNGAAVARCTIFMGGNAWSSGIAYSSTETTESNSFNENMSVEADDQSMFLKSMGMSFSARRDGNEKLSQEGAAELYWGILIEPLQQSRRR